jgi:hypothetical protein
VGTMMSRLLRAVAAALLLALTPNLAWACACGCGVFDVGTSAMFPTGSGITAFLELDAMDQNRNWSGASSAPAQDNPDKEIRTTFYTAGLRYMVNRSWGVIVQVPYWDRAFRTTGDTRGIADFTHGAIGDVRLKGIYTGFSPDLSSGITFGVKLPTGDSTYPNFDRDTEIGTGSTDLLLGGYHLGPLAAGGSWDYFAQGDYERALATRGGYRPGDEIDAALGAYYNKGTFGMTGKIVPVLQLILSSRLRDSGPAAAPADSGYRRLLISPGVELNVGGVRLYGDVEFPLYQHVNGNQLVAPALFKFVVSTSF